MRGRAGAFIVDCAPAVALLLVGQTIWLAEPGFNAIALILVPLAIGLCALAIAWQRSDEQPRSQRSFRALAIVAIVAGIAQLPWTSRFFGQPAAGGAFIPLALFALVLIAVILFTRSRSLAAAAFWILLSVYLLMGVSYLKIDTGTTVDVWLVQNLGCDALVHGHNPFAMTFPDIYGPLARIYPPGMVIDRQVQCGYFYPPLSLLMDLPAYFCGDVRYAHLIAIIATAALIAYARPARRAYTAAIALLFTPGIFYLLRGAWIEPFLALLLAAACFFAARRRTALTFAMLGLFFAAKQYAFFAAPAALLLLPRPWRWRDMIRYGLIAAVCGAAVTLPFILLNPGAFLHSQRALYVGMLRFDSISFVPLLAKRFAVSPSLAFPATAATVAAAFVVWRAARTPAAFAVSVALIFLCAFVFSTQAFANYYFLTAPALCCAVALPEITSASSVPPPSSVGHRDQ